jgi:hypothetical protein
MNMPTSSGNPVRWLISTIGVMSATVVRAAQLAWTFSFASDDLARQALHIDDDVRAGAGQANVGGIDAEPVDAVENLDLLRYRRRPHRRRLQPVAKRFIVEHDPLRLGGRADLVPVVNQGLEHLSLRAGGKGRGRGAGSRDDGEPQRRLARGGTDHRPESVIDGRRRQALLVPDDLRSDEGMAGPRA